LWALGIGQHRTDYRDEYLLLKASFSSDVKSVSTRIWFAFPRRDGSSSTPLPEKALCIRQLAAGLSGLLRENPLRNRSVEFSETVKGSVPMVAFGQWVLKAAFGDDHKF
jgi:hypothetical protein